MSHFYLPDGLPPITLELLDEKYHRLETIVQTHGQRNFETVSDFKFARLKFPNGADKFYPREALTSWKPREPYDPLRESRQLFEKASSLDITKNFSVNARKFSEIQTRAIQYLGDYQALHADFGALYVDPETSSFFVQGFNLSLEGDLGRLGPRSAIQKSDFVAWRFLQPIYDRHIVSGDAITRPLSLLLTRGELRVKLELPSSISSLTINVGNQSNLTRIDVRISTCNAQADSILEYLNLGAIADAKMLAESTIGTEQARKMMVTKLEDPYSAALGGYLLLKTREFDKMFSMRYRFWSRNLRDWAPHLSDGAIIWAWQLALDGKAREESGESLEEAFDVALERGLPKYTEGVKLLLEGLRLLGSPERLNKGLELAKSIFWSSPYTTSVEGSLLDEGVSLVVGSVPSPREANNF